MHRYRCNRAYRCKGRESFSAGDGNRFRKEQAVNAARRKDSSQNDLVFAATSGAANLFAINSNGDITALLDGDGSMIAGPGCYVLAVTVSDESNNTDTESIGVILGSTPMFTVSSATVNEGDPVNIDVTLLSAPVVAVTLNWSTQGGSATQDTDYVGAIGPADRFRFWRRTGRLQNKTRRKWSTPSVKRPTPPGRRD